MKRLQLLLLAFAILTSVSAQDYQPTARGEVVKHNYYTLSYIEEHEQPEWVYYTLTPEMVSGSAVRKNNFRADKSVSTGSASLADYKGSGYDRGHLAPAASMSINDTAMSESFLLSNMSPQLPSFNRGKWKTLEETIRKWALSDSVLYVVTGAILKDDLNKIGANGVSIPRQYYKAVYSPRKEMMVGFVMPNKKIEDGIENYIVSIDTIEELTGIDLFAGGSAKMEQLEAKATLLAPIR